jgi:penicillin G amidase
MPSSLLRLMCLLGVLAAPACRRPAPPAAAPAVVPLPQVSGSLAVPGVGEPVRIVRDRWGVPHIYARNEHDLFFAQGFVQAQDRLFQIDLWRRSVQGRLSEVLGLNFVERDAATRRIQYHGDAAADWASYGPGVKAIAEAFVAGINAWVDEARVRVPEEFILAGWLPEKWSAEDLLNRTDAFVAAGADADVFRARLVAALGEQRANVWLPAGAPYRRPAGLAIDSVPPVVGEALRRAGTAPFFLGLAAPVLAPADRGAGSNAWVVSGARSATGAPLLASDPHRPFAHPSLRYLVHLNAPGWNVIGAASPWLPGVVIGHNERVAWGMTSSSADVADVYVEHVNPANPHQVQYRGRWANTTVVPDPIVMKGQAKPFPFEREHTPNGVIVATDSERHLAFSVKWSGSEPGTAGELAALALARADSASSFRASLVRWRLPAVEVVYAAVDGAAGRQVAGLLPARSGWDGALPAPGWDGAFEWRGWRRPDELPHAVVPAAGGFVASANQNEARSNRLDELLGGAHPDTVDDFKRFQLDTTAWNAAQLMPLLAGLVADRSEVEAARRSLMQWDGRIAADSAAASLYVFWEEAVLRKLAESRLGPDLRNDYVARAGLPVTAVTKPSRAWFDGDAVRARDRLLLEALAAAVDRGSTTGGAASSSWGSLHTLIFKHPLAISQAARRRFNVGPFELAGYPDTVLSTFPSTDVTGGASFRQIVDLSDWDRSVWTNAPGQSGAPGSRHFADLARPWSAGEYFPMAFSDAAVEAAAETTLTLTPR